MSSAGTTATAAFAEYRAVGDQLLQGGGMFGLGSRRCDA